MLALRGFHPFIFRPSLGGCDTVDGRNPAPVNRSFIIGWWQLKYDQICYMFIPTTGKMIQFDYRNIFANGLEKKTPPLDPKTIKNEGYTPKYGL